MNRRFSRPSGRRPSQAEDAIAAADCETVSTTKSTSTGDPSSRMVRASDPPRHPWALASYDPPFSASNRYRPSGSVSTDVAIPAESRTVTKTPATGAPAASVTFPVTSPARSRKAKFAVAVAPACTPTTTGFACPFSS